jgi:hypothetical protein
VSKVNAALSRPFTMHLHTRCWRYFKVRPPSGAADPTTTRADFCRWNPAFEQHVYTEAWVNFLVRKLSDDDVFGAVAAHVPTNQT